MKNYSTYAHNAAHARKVIGGATQAVALIREHFGEDGVFTKKEYEAIAKHSGASCIDTLSYYGFIVIDHEDNFTIKLKEPWSHEDWMVNAKGEKVMRPWDYRRMPQTAKEAITAMNGGEALVEKEFVNYEVDAKRYHWKLNLPQLDAYCARQKKDILASSRQMLAKAEKQVAMHKAILAYYGA